MTRTIRVNSPQQISIEPHGPTLIIATRDDEYQLLFGNGAALCDFVENATALLDQYSTVLAAQIKALAKSIEALTPLSTDEAIGTPV